VILAIMNGGKADYEKLDPKPIFLSKFKTECGDIWAAMILADPNRFLECKAARIKAGKDYNHQGSFINKTLCHWENKILGVIVRTLQEIGAVRDTAVLCFDGVMVPKASRGRREAADQADGRWAAIARGDSKVLPSVLRLLLRPQPAGR
jgi:hypothetical protein